MTYLWFIIATASKFLAGMPLFDNEECLRNLGLMYFCWTLEWYESNFNFRANMSLIDSGRWFQVSFCAMPPSLVTERLQTQSLINTSVSSNNRLQTQPLSLIANGMLEIQHYSISVSGNNKIQNQSLPHLCLLVITDFKLNHYHPSVFGSKSLQF